MGVPAGVAEGREGGPVGWGGGRRTPVLRAGEGAQVRDRCVGDPDGWGLDKPGVFRTPGREERPVDSKGGVGLGEAGQETDDVLPGRPGTFLAPLSPGSRTRRRGAGQNGRALGEA